MCHHRVVDVTIRRLVLLDGEIDPGEAIARPVIVGELWANILTEAIVWQMYMIKDILLTANVCDERYTFDSKSIWSKI
jgi:hypothetical protein